MRHVPGILGAASALVMLCCATMAWSQEKEKPQYDAYEEFAKANKYVNYGSYSRAIPHYERTLAADPITYNIVHYNLGELYRAKKNCVKAVFHYTAYLGVGNDEEALQLSKKSISECDTSSWPSLTVKATPEGATVKINGYIFAQGKELGTIKLGPGDYNVEVEAPEYIAQMRSVSLKSKEEKQEEFSLEKQTFFGTVTVKVDPPGATVKLIPKKLDKPELSQGDQSMSSPVKEPVKLSTGKYLLEVNKDGFDRWIRHVYITRDQNIDVEVSLTKAIPVELKVQ